MGRMSTKTEKRSYHHGNLREAVLHQACIFLERDGASNVSLREIGRVLGVSHTAPRRHFPTKQLLLDALAIYGYAQLGAGLARALRHRDAAFEVRLQRATSVLVRFALKNPALLGHMFAAKHQPDATPELIEASQVALSSGIQLLAEGQETGDVVEGDPEVLALVPFATVQGLIVVSSHGTFKGISLEKLVEQATHHILVGLRPRG
jgi:AcrR family transcriptional regulator